MKFIKPEEAFKMINESNGKLFTAFFIKKDGSKREMNCRLGVTKHLKGGQLKYDPIARNMIPVYDMKSQGYRMINLATLFRIKIGGNDYSIAS